MPGRERARAWRAAVLIAFLVAAALPCGANPVSEAIPPPAPKEEAAQPPASTAAKQNAPAKGRGAKKEEDEEVRLGRRVAVELEREYKLVKNPQQLERLGRIGRDIAVVCAEPKYHYTFKILDIPEVNALSLPGGFIYVTKGMMGYVRSDDELAGVLAHEIAHAACHHVKDLLRRENKMNQQMLLGLLGAIITGAANSQGFGNLLFGAEMLKTAYLSGYSQKAETEADRAGIDYLIKTGRYNPVGALTVIERLSRDDARRTGAPLGIFQTHPESNQRAKTMEDYLSTKEIPINRLVVQDTLRATAHAIGDGIPPAAEVVFNELVIFQTSAGMAGATAIADHINRLMLKGLQMRDIRLGTDGTSVIAANEVLFTVTPADASLQGKSPAEVASLATRSLTRALWKAFMDQAF